MSEYDNNEYEDTTQIEDNGEEEVRVSMGKKKTGIIIVVFLIFILMILYLIKGCSITKKVETPVSSTNTVSVTKQTSENTTSNVVETSSEITETTTVFVEPSNSLPEETKEVISAKPKKEETKDDGIEEVNEPVLSETISTSGLVSGKSVYKVGNSYMYSVSLIVVTGNEKNVPCKYFCPKNTWDALNVGDTLKVSFQTDTNGNISVNTISK